MTKPDWILVETTDVGAIQRQLLVYEEICEGVPLQSRHTSVHLAADGFYVVTFEPMVKRHAFLNMVGYLSDHPDVSKTVGWITDGAIRYALEPDRSRLTSNSETEYLIGSSKSGSLVEACLSDGAAEIMTLSREGDPIREPVVALDGTDPALRFLLMLEV